VSFKLYDEDAVLVEQLADTSSFTNLCTNVFRSYFKAQEDFRKNGISKLSGEVMPESETELALIPMPAALWDAYLAKAQELSERTGIDVGCEELMLRILSGAATAIDSLLEESAKLPKASGQ
jgi:hypothetical protein